MPDPSEKVSAETDRSYKVPKAIDLKAYVRNPILRRLVTLLEYPIEKALSIGELNNVYERSVLEAKGENFLQNCLDILQVRYSVSRDDLHKIPSEGPLVVVANHPFGGLEGVILGALIRTVRGDAKALGNYLLQNVPELREWVIPVNPFGTVSATASNRKGLKEAIQWVKQGGALITFPAGVVSHLHWRQGTVTDSEWSRHVGAVIHHARANVLPVYFPGKNSFLFQVMGLLHPMLRTALIPREFVNKRSKTIELYIGKPIPWRKLETIGTHEAMVDYLRVNTYFLRNRAPGKKTRFASIGARKTKESKYEQVIPEVPRHLLRREVDSLPESQRLVDTRDFAVYVAESTMIPNLLREIGRLRELTFREVKEGTGKSVDLDRFDQYYLHLFLWSKTQEELVGAYRLGLIDKILLERGRTGLYTSTLFRFKSGLLNQLKNAIELGRSFVRSKYQKEYSCLSLLWNGIGVFIVRNPRYNTLFGPISISHDYHAVSKNLLVQFLRQYRSDSELSRYVRPRSPYRDRRGKTFRKQSFPSCVRDIDDVSLLISEIEKNGRGIPILLRHYLKLNATILSFNVDKHFSNVVDGLILVDLTKTDAKLLKRFMGKEGLEAFARHQEISPDPDIARLAHLDGLAAAAERTHDEQNDE